MAFKIVTGKTGSAHVASADDGAFNAAVFGTDDYVLDLGNGTFGYTVVDNNNITIAPGDLLLQGRHCRLGYGETENVSIDSGTVGYDRIDLIVAEYTNNSGIEDCTISVIKGTPAVSSPTAPTATDGDILQGDTLHQFALYEVYISGINIDTVTSQFSDVIKPAGFARTAEYTSTVTTSWTGASAPYTQTIKVTGIKSTDNPIVDMIPSSTYATALLEESAWGKIYRITTAADSITLYAKESTTQAVNIRLKVVR